MKGIEKENHKVSIIVPVYNASAYIEETIATVLEQTYEDWELLLVNDCATDDTPEKMRKYENNKIRVLRLPVNQGAARARNRGVAEASGRYIAFLDADDRWKKDKLEKELAFMEEKEAAFAFTSYEFADEFGHGNGKVAHVPPTLNYREALKNTIIFTTTVMFDLTKIDKTMLLMPEVKSEDTAAWWNILRHGYTAFGLQEVLAYYRRPPRSLSSNKLEAVRRIWHLYRRVEGLSFWYSVYNFVQYAYRTTMRRL